jgi:hypothetical protein
MINSRKYMMGTKLLQTKGTWYWDGPTCMSALIVICKREYIGKGQKILPGNGPSTTCFVEGSFTGKALLKARYQAKFC